jgi:hypothetical protein
VGGSGGRENSPDPRETWAGDGFKGERRTSPFEWGCPSNVQPWMNGNVPGGWRPPATVTPEDVPLPRASYRCQIAGPRPGERASASVRDDESDERAAANLQGPTRKDLSGRDCAALAQASSPD